MFYLEGMDFIIYLFNLISAPANNPDEDVTNVISFKNQNMIKDIKKCLFPLEIKLKFSIWKQVKMFNSYLIDSKSTQKRMANCLINVLPAVIQFSILSSYRSFQHRIVRYFFYFYIHLIPLPVHTALGDSPS